MERTKWEYKTTPGSDDEYCTIYVPKGKAIARHVLPEHAEFIVRACECHDDLVNTLESCLEHLDNVLDEQISEHIYVQAEKILKRAKE